MCLHAFSQRPLSWLLQWLALVPGQQLTQLWVNALLLSILPAPPQDSMCHSGIGRHSKGEVSLTGPDMPALGSEACLQSLVLRKLVTVVKGEVKDTLLQSSGHVLTYDSQTHVMHRQTCVMHVLAVH